MSFLRRPRALVRLPVFERVIRHVLCPPTVRLALRGASCCATLLAFLLALRLSSLFGAFYVTILKSVVRVVMPRSGNSLPLLVCLDLVHAPRSPTFLLSRFRPQIVLDALIFVSFMSRASLMFTLPRLCRLGR